MEDLSWNFIRIVSLSLQWQKIAEIKYKILHEKCKIDATDKLNRRIKPGNIANQWTLNLVCQLPKQIRTLIMVNLSWQKMQIIQNNSWANERLSNSKPKIK